MKAKFYRVAVNFPESERSVLTALCVADIRPPDDQIRYLIREEAQRRGLANKNEDTGLVSQAKPASSTPQSHKATAPLVGS